MRFLVILLSVFSFASFGLVVETKKMSEVMDHVDGDTLLIFDLDNTIIMPAQTLGGEEWFDYLVKKYAEENTKALVSNPIEAAKARALKEWNSVQYVTSVVRVEDDSHKWIKEAQEKGAKTMALTARPYVLAKATSRALESVSLTLWHAPFYQQIVKVKDVEESTFERSVMYVGATNSKGKVLVKFLAAAKKLPKKIVFVDNKEHHVKAVEGELKPLKIDYVGCRHGASDEKISNFKPEIADLQFKYFGKILDDAAAKRLLTEPNEEEK